MNSTFICICFVIWVTLCECKVHTKSFNLTAKGFRVKAEIVKKLEHQTLSTCALECSLHHYLVAFNFSPANGSCEIIRKPNGISTGNLVQDSNYNFYNTLHPCNPNPCKYSSKCVETLDGLDYSCSECHRFLKGKNCTEFAKDLPSKSVFRFNSTMYAIYKPSNSAFKNAYTQCESEKLDLALIKNKEVHDFLKPKFNDWTVNDISVKNLMWFGLNRTSESSESSEWMWADGTPLGEYRPWENKKTQNGNCATLNFNTTHYYWHATSCKVANTNHRYYVLCQLN